MKIFLSVLTVAGGHLLAGKRIRGYLYLAALVSLPVLSWLVQGIWLVFAPKRLVEAPVVAAGFFWVALVTVWLSSIGLLMRDGGSELRATEPPRRVLLVLETVVVSIASIILIGFSVLSVGVVPFLPQEKRLEARDVGKAGVRGQELPNREGSVQFLGTLYVKGSVASSRKLVFLFDKGFISRGIVTDHEGKFTYTLPPGRWTLLAPYLPGFPGDISFDIEPPVQQRQLSFDVSEGPVSQTYNFVVRAN
jgi:hypothetical protein